MGAVSKTANRFEVVGDGLEWFASGQEPVIALHCSGADGGEWRHLGPAVGPRFRVLAPDLIGSGDKGHWHGEHGFSLQAEANSILALVDRLPRPVHLIGHSYGGGVALKVAGLRREKIASLALYEPSAFHLLGLTGGRGIAALDEVKSLSQEIGASLLVGAFSDAARRFVDYWNGCGAWDALGPKNRQALLRWLPKVSLDFHALIHDDAPLDRISTIDCPVLLMRGEHALGPSRMIIDELQALMRFALVATVDGAGHMGPLTHRDVVFGAIADQLSATLARTIPASAA